MNKVLLSFLVMLLHVACNNRHELRKLSKEEAFARQVADIWAETKSIMPTIKDLDGNDLDMSQTISMSFDSLGFDFYVDSNNSLVLQVIRVAEPEDRKYSDKLDSMLIADPVFLEKFIISLGVDEETQNEIRKTYTEYSYFFVQLKTQNVNCDEIGVLLQEALIEDQRSRNNLFPNSTNKDRQNQELVLGIFEMCGATKIEEAGYEAINSAFMIVQHGQKDIRLKYFKYFEDWAYKGYLNPNSLALMIDRMRIDAGLEQIYGTQVRKHPNGQFELLPLIDPEKVYYRRDSVGLGSLEEYLKNFENK